MTESLSLAPRRIAGLVVALFALAVAVHPAIAGASVGEPAPEVPTCVGCHTSAPEGPSPFARF